MTPPAIPLATSPPRPASRSASAPPRPAARSARMAPAPRPPAPPPSSGGTPSPAPSTSGMKPSAGRRPCRWCPGTAGWGARSRSPAWSSARPRRRSRPASTATTPPRAMTPPATILATTPLTPASRSTGPAILHVGAGPLAKLRLGPSEATIKAGGQVTYHADGADAYGNPLGELTAKTGFSFDVRRACTESTCTATRTGDYTVTGTVTGTKVTGTAILHVGAGPLAKLRLGPSEATIQAGGQVTYHADGADAYGNPLGELTAKTGFSIDLPGACTGTTCTATRTGDYTVTGTVTGTKVTGTAILHVGAGPLAKLRLGPSEATIQAGGQVTYHADGADAYGNPLGELTAKTGFSIDLPGACTGTTCTATRTGDYTVTGTVTGTKVDRKST